MALGRRPKYCRRLPGEPVSESPEKGAAQKELPREQRPVSREKGDDTYANPDDRQTTKLTREVPHLGTSF